MTISNTVMVKCNRYFRGVAQMVERYIRDVEVARSNRVTPTYEVVNMTKLEMEFFDEFKSVDNICRDMFESQQGVTEYINQMESNDLLGSRSVVNWNEKYKKLKHLRWLRNQIAHDSGAPELEESDLLELQHFHKQLLKQKDPLAIISKSQRELKKSPPKMRVDYSSFDNPHDEDEEMSPLVIVGFIVVAVVLGFIAWKLLAF